MEISEAIVILKDYHESQTRFNEIIGELDDEFCDALGLAISALEKQEGKKPKIVPNEFQKYEKGEWNDYLCPKCGKMIISRNNGQWFCGKKQHFCDLCGQRIDWSDEE